MCQLFYFFSLQGIVQILDIVSSFVIIRYLPKEQYSLYLLSLSISMSLNTLSDMGVGSVVLSEGGKVWTQKDRMSSLMFAYAHFRKRLAFIFGILVASTSAYLFYLNKFTLVEFLLSLSIMSIDFLFKFRYYGNKYILQLAGEIITIQKLETNYRSFKTVVDL